uniref:AAA domain-containing protein n=1 Tax=Strongyloides stercoralis TaxID=6248 RepID=A0A0K0E0R8_STRER
MSQVFSAERETILSLLKSGSFLKAKELCSKVIVQIKNQMPPHTEQARRASCQKIYHNYKDIENEILQYTKIFGTESKLGLTCTHLDDCKCLVKGTSTPQRRAPAHHRRLAQKGVSTPKIVRGVRRSRGAGIHTLKKKTSVNVEVPVNILSDAPKIDPVEGKSSEAGDDFMASLPADVADVLNACISESHSTTTWDSVVGLDDVKKCLFLNVKVAPQFKNIFKGIRQPLRTFLLYGPPGTGKTLIGKALANECGRKFLMVSPSIITSKWRGDSEKLIKYLFEMAGHFAPSVLFFDELDGFCMKRGSKTEHEATRRFMSEFLVRFEELNKCEEDVCLIGATNTPWDIDAAVMRRFDARFFVSLPCDDAIVSILKNCLFDQDLEQSFDFHRIAEKLEGYSASDVVKICRRASLRAVEDYFCKVDINLIDNMDVAVTPYLPISEDDFTFYISKTPSTVTKEMLDMYSKYSDQ